MLSLLRKLFSSKKSDAEVLDPAGSWPFPPAIPAAQEPEKPAEPTEPTPAVAPAKPKPKRAPVAKKPAVVAKSSPRKPRAKPQV